MRNSKPSSSKLTSPPKKKRPPLRKKSSTPPPTSDSTAPHLLREDDHIALEAFCKNLDFSEITLLEWEHGFDALDISVPIWITDEDARDGCERPIAFSRSIRTEGDGPVSREKMQITLQIPSGSQHQARISFPGKGDVRGGQQGDLIVIIHIKGS